jgi:hypothetical protein
MNAYAANDANARERVGFFHHGCGSMGLPSNIAWDSSFKASMRFLGDSGPLRGRRNQPQPHGRGFSCFSSPMARGTRRWPLVIAHGASNGVTLRRPYSETRALAAICRLARIMPRFFETCQHVYRSHFIGDYPPLDGLDFSC